ncbi:MAG: YSC84-related protein [Pseudomonadota bacterium]
MRLISQLGVVVLAAMLLTGETRAADREVIEARVDLALTELRAAAPEAAELLAEARGVLVMPEVTRAGFVVGGYYGEGALRVDGVTVAYYSVAGGSLGLLAGVETSSQVMLFMTDEALEGFRRADGWEAGANANVTVLQAGIGRRVDTTVQDRPIVAYVFGQQGLMAGVGLDGAKYSRIER